MAVQERLERLLNLTAALLSATRPLSALEISQRVPGYPDPEEARSAFRRAFERDKEALRDMGVPIELSTIEGTDPPLEGYRISPEHYQLRDPGLQPDELAALHLATLAVRMEGLRGDAMSKLGGAARDPSEAPIARIAATPLLGTLFDAVAKRSPVRFSYRQEQREVDPLRLSYARGQWYLDCWDHSRDALRQFRLDRIEGNIEIDHSRHFEPIALGSPSRSHAFEMGDEPPLQAIVRVDPDQAELAVDQLGADRVSRRFEDGTMEFSITVTSRAGFRSWVLGFLDHAVIVEPDELREDLVEWLQTIMNATN